MTLGITLYLSFSELHRQQKVLWETNRYSQASWIMDRINHFLYNLRWASANYRLSRLFPICREMKCNEICPLDRADTFKVSRMFNPTASAGLQSDSDALSRRELCHDTEISSPMDGILLDRRCVPNPEDEELCMYVLLLETSKSMPDFSFADQEELCAQNLIARGAESTRIWKGCCAR